MKRLLTTFLLFIVLTAKSYTPEIMYEWFSLGGGFLYSIEDQYLGLNGKINLPLGSHVKFVMQGSLFPEQFQNPERSYNEIRAKFNVEFTPVKFNHFYLTLQTGFDYGYWQRTFEVLNSTLGTNWKREESMMFGGILNYDFHRYRLYLDYMYMPEVYSNHVGIGITMLFFEDSRFRRLYFQRRKSKSPTRRKSSTRSRSSA